MTRRPWIRVTGTVTEPGTVTRCPARRIRVTGTAPTGPGLATLSGLSVGSAKLTRPGSGPGYPDEAAPSPRSQPVCHSDRSPPPTQPNAATDSVGFVPESSLRLGRGIEALPIVTPVTSFSSLAPCHRPTRRSDSVRRSLSLWPPPTVSLRVTPGFIINLPQVPDREDWTVQT